MAENNEQTELSIEEEERKGTESFFEWLDFIIPAIIAVVLVFTFLFGKAEVVGRSMLNTLKNGDQLIITGWNYTPKCGDIVILARHCSDTEAGKVYTENPLVKRIIATEGQTVEIKNGEVYVDDKRLNEDYIRTKTDTNGFEGKQTVPKDCVFVMGDNRDESADGRLIGFVNRNYILGKVIFRLFPFDSIKSF